VTFVKRDTPGFLTLIADLFSLYILKRQVEELKIRAGVSGVLQQLSIEGGQRVAVARALGG
jgi:hypothetical protein